MVVLSTTAILLYTANHDNFVVEADPGNTTNVRLSSTDPNVAVSFISLVGGQQQVYEDWVGSIWAVAASATPSVYVEFPNKGTARTFKEM